VRRQAARLILVAAALATGCATAPPSPPRLLVHVDTLAPDKLQAFENARVRWVALLRAHKRDDRRGLYLKIGTNTYYSIVTFSRWRELEQIGAERAATSRALADAAREYDRLSDESLVFPHASEVWREQPELAYLPTGRPLGDAVQLVIEDVKPTADYEAAWKPIAAALLQAKFPVERRSYFAGYGSGRTLSFWLAPSAAVLRAAPTIEQALASVVGEARAKELMAAWRACVVATQTFDVEPKAEMSLP
jgi:hypothetical protein